MRVPTQRTKFRNNTELGQGVAEGRDTKQESKALAWSWVSKEERAVFYSAANSIEFPYGDNGWYQKPYSYITFYLTRPMAFPISLSQLAARSKPLLAVLKSIMACITASLLVVTNGPY
jgi:hypothetical protein